MALHEEWENLWQMECKYLHDLKSKFKTEEGKDPPQDGVHVPPMNNVTTRKLGAPVGRMGVNAPYDELRQNVEKERAKKRGLLTYIKQEIIFLLIVLFVRTHLLYFFRFVKLNAVIFL